MTNEQVIATLKNMIRSNNEHGNTLLCIGEVQALNMAIEALSAQPEIIRCKECKHWAGEIKDGFYCFEWCLLTGVDMTSDDFCSHAERRTDETD